jgi:hypothetical protein
MVASLNQMIDFYTGSGYFINTVERNVNASQQLSGGLAHQKDLLE